MPPPPLNPQGSRAGLITAVVVLSILFVTSAIFAFYFSAENNKKEASLKTTTEKLNQYANGEAQGDPAVAALLEGRPDPSQSAIQVALTKLGNLAKAVTGSTNLTPPPEQAAADVVTMATDKDVQAAGVTNLTPNSSLKDVVTALVTRVKALAAESQQKSQQLDASAEKLKQETAQRQQVETELNGKFEEQGKQLADALATLASKREESEKSVQTIQGEVDRAAKSVQAENSKRQKEITDKNAKIAELEEKIKILETKIVRPENTANAVIRQADARIVRVPGNDNVFIDLGEGDGISPGLTFEVYDRFGGVPGITNDEEVNPTDEGSLPKGKASIEVVRPGQRQSECRIIRQSGAKPVVEGDIVANLVYDKNTKYNFVVFGDFDLDQNAVPTPADAEVIKERIVKWGGRLQDEVNVNADFVVLGVEPEVPVQTEDEDATAIAQREKKQKEYEAYQDVVSTAKGLNIPILNQNRFLYYTGYYEQSQR
jgi:hypothetical protein